MASKSVRKRGIVQAFNVSPKGVYEGLLIKSEGKLIQVNFPPESAADVTGVAVEGKQIVMEVEPEQAHENASHPVYRLISATSGKKKFAIAGSQFSGTVQRLNYALHGEVNGAILDTGDFLHLKPHGAAALSLKIGMKITASGTTKPMADGLRVIEAAEVNGVPLGKKPKKKAHK